MKSVLRFAITFALSGLCISIAPAFAAGYPAKPVRIIVTVGAGGATDIMARALGGALSHEMGQAFVVVNQPGASGIIGAEALTHSPADGYTLLLTQTTLSTLNSLLFKKLPYDPAKLSYI